MFSKGPVALCNERKPSGLACAACFEELAGVFASSGATHYAKIGSSNNFCVEYNPQTLSDFPTLRAAYGEHVKHGTNR